MPLRVQIALRPSGAVRWWLYALAALMPGSLPVLGVLWLIRLIRQGIR